MAATMTLISSQVLGASTATVTFSSIPQTYNDLKLVASVRGDYSGGANFFYIAFNSAGAFGSQQRLTVDGNPVVATAYTSANSTNLMFSSDYVASGANIFGSSEIYLANYTSSGNKQFFGFGAAENNTNPVTTGVAFGLGAGALLWTSTAITSIAFSCPAATNFIANSAFYLYGIKNS